MPIRLVILLIACISLLPYFSFSAGTDRQQCLVQFGNSLNFLELKTGDHSTSLKFTFGYGGVYESDSSYGISGVCRHYIKEQLDKSIATGKLNGAIEQFDMEYTHEKVSYLFKCKSESVAAIAEEVVRIVSDTSVKAESVTRAVQAYVTECNTWNRRPDAKLLSYVSRKMYRTDARQFSPVVPINPSQITANGIYLSLQAYFIPDNCLITVVGNTTGVKDRLVASVPVIKWRKQLFNRDKYVRFLDYKPLVNSSQYVSAKSTVDPDKLSFTFLLSGAANNPKSINSAFLFASYLSYANQFTINDSIPPVSINGVFTPGVRSSTYELQCNVGNNDPLELQEAFIKHLKRIPQRLSNAVLEDCKFRFREDYDDVFNKTPNAFANILQTLWWRENPRYWLQMPDSVATITLREFQSFISDFVSNSAFISVLHTNDTMVNDSAYLPVDDDVQSLLIPYDKNSSDYNDSISGKGLCELVQWMKLNRDYRVQINGISDDSEYYKTKDESILQFIDTIPSFKKIMPDIINKGYIRLEMMRSLKIARYLYSHGIETNRITGTSMMFHSTKDEDPATNRKCTFTFYVARQRPTLYEQHYGHPKGTQQ